MGSYTITFTPDDVSNASAVVRVDLGAAGARITELTVRAGNGDGLIPGELPGFDLGRLLRAIAPAGQTAPSFELSAAPVAPAPAIGAYEAESAVAAPAKRTAARATATRGATGRTPAKRGTATRGAAKQTTAKQTAAAKKTAAKATAGTGRGARKAASATSGRATTRTGATAARTARAAQGAGRAYRRTPEDIVEVFTQAPSATALARHYGVPRHTVQGWLRRLRAEGVLPPSSRATA